MPKLKQLYKFNQSGHVVNHINYKKLTKSLSTSRAYIPLQCKTAHVGPSRWFRPPTRPFCVGDSNMLVSKRPTPSLVDQRQALRTQRQDWQTQREPVEYSSRRVGFALFIPLFFCIGYPTQTLFPVEYGLYSIIQLWTTNHYFQIRANLHRSYGHLILAYFHK